MGFKIGFGSTPTGLKIGLEVLPVVENSIICLIEAVSWLEFCFNKFYLDLWKYSHGVEDRL